MGLATHPPGATAHRLVLLALVVPMILLGIVFWVLLPGGVASMSYTPSQFSQAVQVQPLTWRSREVAVQGYLARGCAASAPGRPAVTGCTLWLLVDHPVRGTLSSKQATALGALRVLPQHESAWHAFFRRLIPGLATPFPRGVSIGRQVTITGAVQGSSITSSLPIFVPKGL